jgi:molecular chaperone DnaK (HSP70)
MIQNDVQHSSFEVVRGGSDGPQIEVQWEGGAKRFLPEEISALVSAKMRGIAESRSVSRVTGLVIPVLARFKDAGVYDYWSPTHEPTNSCSGCLCGEWRV